MDSSPFLSGPDITALNPVTAYTYLGDYHHMANAGPGLRGPTVYCAYMTSAVDPATGLWSRRNCYLHKITPLCISDFNLSGASEPIDIEQFYGAYFSWDGMSDLNADGVIDLLDEELFWNTYDHLDGNQ